MDDDSGSVDGLMVGRSEREMRERRDFIYSKHGYIPGKLGE